MTAVDADIGRDRGMKPSPQHEPTAQERAEIDEAFAALTEDREFQAESAALAEEAVQSGWEALRESEADR
jgi:hypothetical protein